MEVISDYIDITSTELEVIRSEFEVIIKLFPENIKPLPRFNVAMQDESWSATIKTLIASFETTANSFQYTLVP